MSGSDDARNLRARVVQLGLLDAAAAQDALERYERLGASERFDSFLLEQGLLDQEKIRKLYTASVASGPASEPGNDDTHPDGPATPQDEPVAFQSIGSDPRTSPADWSTDRTEIAPRSDLRVGQRFSGAVVERKLGEGGMGLVYLATRESDGTAVVVKFLGADQVNNRRWRARFLREARVTQSISHPNVVKIFSIESEGKEPHLVMELIEGESLERTLGRGKLPPLEAARVARDVARGLAEAHERGIVHRDIKPANIMVSAKGVTKVLDFGLAKDVKSDDGLSIAGQVLGTPYYMAPEQWGDHEVDGRCDVFALGATLYHLVTGQHAFPGYTKQEISQKILAGVYVTPRTLAPNLPADLELVILKMLAVERDVRPSAAQCVKDLERVLEGQPVPAPHLADKRDGKHHVLLPRPVYLLGRDASCDIVVLDRSVSRQHARIDRTKTGYVLKDLGSRYGTFVGGMQVKEILLKDGDELKVGLVPFAFRDAEPPEVPRAREPSAARATVLWVPFVTALVEAGDRRAVLALLEEMAPDAIGSRVAAARAQIGPLLGEDTAAAVATRLEAVLKERRSNLAAILFSITHENLHEDLEAWLAWWDGSHIVYPPQVVPLLPRPRARVKVHKPGAEPRVLALDEGDVFSVGRDPSSAIALDDPSVSRLHATLLRLDQKLAVRDEGSRLGTHLNGHKVRIAFVGHGDRIALGKIELEIEVEPAPRPRTEGPIPIDADAFLVLEEKRHPSVATALTRFLETETAPAWIAEHATELFDDVKRAGEFARVVHRLYAVRAARARELLAEILGTKAEASGSFRGKLAVKAADLGPQVTPAGWFAR